MSEETTTDVQELTLEEAAEVKGGGFWSWLFGRNKGGLYAGGRMASSSGRYS